MKVGALKNKMRLGNRINKNKYIIYDLKEKKVVDKFRTLFTAEKIMGERKKFLLLEEGTLIIRHLSDDTNI